MAPTAGPGFSPAPYLTHACLRDAWVSSMRLRPVPAEGDRAPQRTTDRSLRWVTRRTLEYRSDDRTSGGSPLQRSGHPRYGRARRVQHLGSNFVSDRCAGRRLVSASGIRHAAAGRASCGLVLAKRCPGPVHCAWSPGPRGYLRCTQRSRGPKGVCASQPGRAESTGPVLKRQWRSTETSTERLRCAAVRNRSVARGSGAAGWVGSASQNSYGNDSSVSVPRRLQA
jgi:hypothetical protein